LHFLSAKARFGELLTEHAFGLVTENAVPSGSAIERGANFCGSPARAMHEAGDFLGVGEHSGGADRHLDTDAYALRELRLNKAARLERASVLPT
jgi:hypothetical protein